MGVMVVTEKSQDLKGSVLQVVRFLIEQVGVNPDLQNIQTLLKNIEY